MKVGVDRAWYALAECIRFPTDLFFPSPGEEAEMAVALCDKCLVRRACFTYAMAHPELYGVWGGTSAEERTLLRRATS
jgi:WhiB family transcriptional regulator, redox-sensing transcriptional regulator